MTVILRPYAPADLPRPAASESEFDDFGPESTLTAPPPWTLWEDGHLAVEVDGTVIGDVGWHWTGYGPGTASRCPMVGISLQREHRGRGLGTEAQRMLVGVLFRGLPVYRVEAWTDVENLVEQRSLEKAGFVREGVLRGAQWRRGAFHDLVAFSVLRAEWQDW